MPIQFSRGQTVCCKRHDMKRKTALLAFGLAALFAIVDLSRAAADETARVISADLQQVERAAQHHVQLLRRRRPRE